MNNIPTQLKILADSSELYEKSEKIGEMFNLHINQVGELDAEIRDILDGFSKSADFVKHIMSRLEIDRATADKIATEINKEVFVSIREQLQAMQADVVDEEAAAEEKALIKNKRSISDLEQLGGFTIEPQPGAGDTGISHIEGKERLINGIENPAPVEIRGVASENVSKTEPLVDHLLSGPKVRIEQKSEIKPTVPPVVKASSTDLYREPIQ